MNDPNITLIIGRLVKDPEALFKQDGKPIARFSIANNSKFSNQEKVNYFDVVAFGNTADFILKYLKKGSRVHIQGELEQNRWQDKSTGQARSSVSIKCLNITSLDSVSQGQQAATQGQQAVPQGQGYGQPTNVPPNAQNGGYNQNMTGYGNNPYYQPPVQPGADNGQMQGPVEDPWANY